MVFETQSFFGVGGWRSEVGSPMLEVGCTLTPETPPMLRQAQHDNPEHGT